MFFNRPQRTNVTRFIATVASSILTLFAASAWGQEGLGVVPDSIFGPNSESLVDENGFLLSAGGGGLWQDEKAPVASPQGQPPTSGQLQVIDDSKQFKLRVGFDALLFERGRAENTVFATEDNGASWAFSDFDFSEGEARYFIQYMADDMTGFEFTFFDFNTFASTIEASGQNVVPFFFQGTPATTGNNFDLIYRSRLKNVELNSWIRTSPAQRKGLGLRHINLDEFYEVLNGGNVATGLFSRTDNDLWGVNKMWERRRSLLDRLTLIGGVDAGLYLNSVKIDVDTANVDDSSEERNLAGSLGFNVGLEYQVADHVILRFGYEGLGLFGVGLASTQSLNQDVINGLDSPDLSSIYFGGFNIGAIATF